MDAVGAAHARVAATTATVLIDDAHILSDSDFSSESNFEPYTLVHHDAAKGKEPLPHSQSASVVSDSSSDESQGSYDAQMPPAA